MEKIHGFCVALKLRLVRPLKESDCKVLDYGSHVQRALTRFDGLRLRVYGEECLFHRGKLSLCSDRRNLKFIGLPSGHSSWRVAGFTDVWPVEQRKRLSWSLGLASASMVALGYPDDLLVHWFWRALAMVPVLLHRLPVGDRVDETTSKQVSSTASALVSSACYLTGLLAHRRLDGSCRYDVRADRLLRGRCCRHLVGSGSR